MKKLILTSVILLFFITINAQTKTNYCFKATYYTINKETHQTDEIFVISFRGELPIMTHIISDPETRKLKGAQEYAITQPKETIKENTRNVNFSATSSITGDVYNVFFILNLKTDEALLVIEYKGSKVEYITHCIPLMVYR